MANLKNQSNVFVLCAAMIIIAAVCCAGISWLDLFTKGPRDRVEQIEMNSAMKQLQPMLTNNPDNEAISFGKGITGFTFYPAKDKGKLLSVIGQGISPIGYGGNMSILVAMQPDGIIQNVIVMSNHETPGLGSKVVDRVQQKTIMNLFKPEKNTLPPNRFLDQLTGKGYKASGNITKTKDTVILPASLWKVKEDGGAIQQITGATVSSRAVTYGVKLILAAYNTHKNEILNKFNK